MENSIDYVYDVALSFAGEDRDYVKQVADFLRRNGVRVFYDEYETANLWGKELLEYLEDVYKNRSKYVLIFSSKAYLHKDWTNHERKSALNRAFVSKEEYILPVMLDDTKLPGLHSSIAYLDGQKMPADMVGVFFLEKIGLKQVSTIESSLTLFRFVHHRYADDFTGESARLHSGRWNNRGIPVIYTASNRPHAILEILINSNGYEEVSRLKLLHISVSSTVSIETVYEGGLPAGWKQNFELTQAIGSRWLTGKTSCILSVPSAVLPNERNYLINVVHPDMAGIKITKVEPANIDSRLFKSLF